MAKLIVRQHDLSVETLRQLRLHGVVDNETLLRLDFFYDAPSESVARRLAAFLVKSTDYDVDVTRGGRSRLRRSWRVTGRTQDTPVSKEIIEQWIRWMVITGAEYGQCRFDGWSAEVAF